MSPAPLLEARELAIGYGKTPLLPPFSITFGEGEFWAVIGRNGGGKTTWIRTLLGLHAPLGGEVIRRPGLRLAYLHQRGVAEDLYPVTARDVVAMGGLDGHLWRPQARGQRRRIEAALDSMGVRHLGDAPFRSLSEGQRQRVLFARVAVSGAHLALLDEPTSAMDRAAEHEAFALLARLREEARVTVVVVSHYLGLVADFADHAVLLDRDAPAVVAGTAREVLAHPSFVAFHGSIPPAPMAPLAESTPSAAPRAAVSSHA